MKIHNLLVVEDDRHVLRALARMLRSTGYVTWTVHSVEGVLDLPREFDAGVFDIELEDGDGVTLARRLHDAGRVRRVIFFTGCTDPERLRAARSIGEVVLKGTSPQLLVDALARQGSRESGTVQLDPWLAQEFELESA